MRSIVIYSRVGRLEFLKKVKAQGGILLIILGSCGITSSEVEYKAVAYFRVRGDTPQLGSQKFLTYSQTCVLFRFFPISFRSKL